jgi:hypothetical protein
VMAGLAWRRFTQSVAHWPRGHAARDTLPGPGSRLPARPPSEAV